MASGRGRGARPAGLRPLGGAARAGRVPRPAAPLARRGGDGARLRHRRAHRAGAGLGGLPRGRGALVPADLPQGAAPELAALPGAGRSAQRPDPAAAHLRGRLRDPFLRRSPGGHAGGRSSHRARSEDRSARRPLPRGARALEVPAVHGGLPRLRRRDRRQRGPGDRLAGAPRRAGRHLHDVQLRPGVLPRRPRLVRQALHLRGVDADAAAGLLPGPHRPRRPDDAADDERGPRPHDPGRGRCRAPPGHAGDERATAAVRLRGADAGRGLLPLLRARRPGVPRAGALRDPHRPLQARVLLQRRSGPSRLLDPPEWELYDLRADPSEVHNVAHDPAYAAVRRRLTRRLAELQAELGDEPHPDQTDPLPAKD